MSKRKSDATAEETIGKKQKNANGASEWSLGPTRALTITAFKGKQYVDIRESYVDKTSGQRKPGKKGISLTPEQFDVLVEIVEDVQRTIRHSDEKPPSGSHED